MFMALETGIMKGMLEAHGAHINTGGLVCSAGWRQASGCFEDLVKGLSDKSIMYPK